MQRSSVDLPDPEGPHRTIRSPARTDRLMSVRALKAPYHFSTPSIAIIGVAAMTVDALAAWLVMAQYYLPSSLLAGPGEDALKACGELRRSQPHPLLVGLRQFSVRHDLVDEGIDRGVDLLLAEPRAGAVVNPHEFELVLIG